MKEDNSCDLLGDFKAEAASLSRGAVATAEGVQLHDLISAVEILDPRTDSNVSYQKVKTLRLLQLSGDILTYDELSGISHQDMQSFVQNMLGLEVQWLEGRSLPQTVYTCPYLFRMDDFRRVCPILHAYLRGVLRFLLLTLETLMRADVREDDEFPVYTFGFDLLHNDTTENVLEALDEAAKLLEKQGASLQLIAYFSLHSSFIRLLNELPPRKVCPSTSISQTLESISNCLSLLRSTDVRTEASVKMFHPVTLKWVATLTPLRVLKPLERNDIFLYLQKIVSDIEIILYYTNFLRKDLAEYFTFVLSFSSRQPCLLARSLLMLLTYDPEKEIFLSIAPMISCVQSMLTDTYGCPTIAAVIQGETKTLHAVCEYRNQRIRDFKKHSARTPPQELLDINLEKQIISAQVSEVVHLIGRFFLHFMYCSLHNRAKYRRRLANLFPELAGLQQKAWDIDTTVLGGGMLCVEHSQNIGKGMSDGNSCEQCASVQQAAVLSALVVDLSTRLMMEYLILGIELQLFANEELNFVFSYMDYILAHMCEFSTTLYRIRELIPRSPKAMRLFSPIVRERKLCFPTPTVALRVDVQRIALNAVLKLHFYLQRSGILAPTIKKSLSSLEMKYKHRFGPFEYLLRPSYFSYASYQIALLNIQEVGQEKLLERTLSLFFQALERLEDVTSTVRSHQNSDPLFLEQSDSLKAAIKNNIVCGKLLNTLSKSGQTSQWEATLEVPPSDAFSRACQGPRESMSRQIPQYRLSRKIEA